MGQEDPVNPGFGGDSACQGWCQVSFNGSVIGKGTLQDQKFRSSRQIDDRSAVAGVSRVYNCSTRFVLEPVGEACPGVAHRRAGHLEVRGVHPGAMVRPEFLQGQYRLVQVEGISIGCLKRPDEALESLGTDDREGSAIGKDRGRAGDEEEIDETGGMVRVKMREEQMPDILMREPGKGQLTNGAGSDVDQYEPAGF